MQQESGSPSLSTAPITAPTGSLGLRKSGGYIQEDFLPQLQGQRARETYFEMSENDSVVAASMFAVTSAIKAVNWRLEPAEADTTNKYVDIVKTMLDDMPSQPWEDVIDDAISMVIYGFALQEPLWRRRNGQHRDKPWRSSRYDDGYWAPYQFAPRSQRSVQRWVYDDTRQFVVGFEQHDYELGQKVVPIHRCLHYKTSGRWMNPEGRSLLRGAYESWYYARRLQQFEAMGIERNLSGYPVMHVPSSVLQAATAETAAALRAYETILKDARRDTREGILLPSDRDDKGNLYYDFSLMASQSTRAIDVNTPIMRYQLAMARSVLADVMFLGTGGSTGSYALSDSKVDMFLTALANFAANIQSQLNQKFLGWVWALNNFPPELRPKFQAGTIRRQDLTALGSFLKQLSESGLLTADGDLEEQLRMIAGLTETPKETRDREPIAPQVRHIGPGRPEGGALGAAGSGGDAGAAGGAAATTKAMLIRKGLI